MRGGREVEYEVVGVADNLEQDADPGVCASQHVQAKAPGMSEQTLATQQVAVPAAQTTGDTSSLQSPPPMQFPFSLLFVGANVNPGSDRRAQLKLKDECKIIREAIQSKFETEAWHGKVEFRADCLADSASVMTDVQIKLSCDFAIFLSRGDTRPLVFGWARRSQRLVDALKAHNKG